MTLNRLADYLDHMRQAIADAQSFTEGMTQADFEQDNWARAQRFEPLERIQGADRD